MAEGTGAPKPGDEKPLHVRVAEVLTGGTAKPYPQFKDGWCIEFPEDAEGWRSMRTAPRYDTDWAATGPLIERFQINLTSIVGGTWEAEGCPCPEVLSGHGCVHGWMDEGGPTPLIAACRLLLALHAAGKLPEAR